MERPFINAKPEAKISPTLGMEAILAAPASSIMNLLVIFGSLCFIIALLLPAIKGTGFFKIGGPGWKIFFLSMVLMAAGFVALFKDTHEKVLAYFLPGLLNILIVLLIILGMLSIHGPGMQLLGAGTLIIWGFIFLLLLFRMRGELQIGSYFWCGACVMLSMNALR